MQKDHHLFCNCCGKEIKIEIGKNMEEYFHYRKSWGYFSQNDGLTQQADICEECVMQWIRGFQIPPDTSERTEIFEC